MNDPFGDLLSRREIAVRHRATIAAARLQLSVVVPSYNTAPFIAETIRSILDQTVRDLEVIVVDDGSADGSLATIDAIRDPRVTCVQQRNRGLAGARNTGILLARAETIGFCDADDVWYPRKAERHLALMAGAPDLGLTFSFSEYLAENGAPTGQLLLTRCRQPGVRDLIRRNHIGNGSTPVVRKDVFRLAGLFDETLGSCEDFEMWVRSAACTPLRLGLLPEVLTGYRVRLGSMTTSYDSFLEGHRLALERFRTYVPDFSERDAARSYAECLRIASRKAFANGQMAISRRLFLRALGFAPTLPLRDGRAFGLLALHLLALPLPASVQPRVYRTAQLLMRHAFRAWLGLGWRDTGGVTGDSRPISPSAPDPATGEIAEGTPSCVLPR